MANETRDAFAPFASLYNLRDYERAAFAGALLPIPDRLDHGAWTPLARFPRDHADGQDVTICVNATPARFYRIEIEPYGDKPGLMLRTGSGQHALAADIALAFAGGMLGVETP